MKIKFKNKFNKYTINFKSLNLFALILSAVLFLLNFVFENPMSNIIVVISTVTAMIIPAYNGIKKINAKVFFNINFIISLSVFFLLCVAEFHQAFWCAIINLLINYIENHIVKFTSNTSQLLSLIQKREYQCYINSENVILSGSEINQGDMVEIFSGGYIPVDGVIQAGAGTIDDYYITGNDKIVTKHTNDTVLAGSTLLTGNIIVSAESTLNESNIAKTSSILNKVKSEYTKKDKIFNLVCNIVSIVLVVVLLIYILFAFVRTNNLDVLKYGIPLIFIASSLDILYNAVNLAYTAIINKSAKLGIIISTKAFLQNTLKINTVLFSTFGVLSSKLPKIISVESIPEITDDDLIKYAAYSQYKLGTEISKALVSSSREKIRSYNIISTIPLGTIGAVTTIAGNNEIVTGTATDLEQLGIITGEINDDTVLCVAVNKTYVGYVKFEAEVKTDVRHCVEDLKSLGVKEVVILSSQSESTINDIMTKSGIDKYYSVKSQEAFADILRKYKKSAVLYRFSMDNFDSLGLISEIKYDGYNNFKDGDSITLVDDLSAPVNHILLLSNLKNLFIQNIAIFILMEIFVAAATLSYYSHIWQIVLIIGVAKILMKYYSIKNIEKI